MASEAAPFVQHSQLRMSPRLPLREWQMAPGCLVVATVAKIGHMANRTARPVQSGIFSVHIIFPSGRVRNGHHHRMATGALLLADRRRLHIDVAHKTGRPRLRSIVSMVEAKSLRVRGRLHDAGVKFRHGPGGNIHVAGLAVGHAIVGFNSLGHAMAVHAIDHLRQAQACEACARRHFVMTSRAVEVIGISLLEMVGV